MKRVKFALAGVALVTAALTMSFSMTNKDAKDVAQENDCWSSPALHQEGEPADRSTIDCPNTTAGCCVKPGATPNSPYLQFSQN